jgi:hypothetical protein
VPDAKESGQQTGNDQDEQEDDECGRKTGRCHANETFRLGARREDDGRRVVALLFQSERQIASRHNLDDAVDTDILLLGLDRLWLRSADVTLTSRRSLNAVLFFGSRPAGHGSNAIVRIPGLGSRQRRSRSRVIRSCALIGALVATDLNGTLEVNLHGIGEFEGLITNEIIRKFQFEIKILSNHIYLEVSVREDGS